MFVCKKSTSFMLIIVLCGAISNTFCMTQWAGSTWQNITESPYTPYALSPVAGATGLSTAYLTCKILDRLRETRIHPGIGIPFAAGIGIAGGAAATLPSLALTEMIRKQREPSLLDPNLSPWSLFYPAIIQGLILGLPFAYYLANKNDSLPTILAATLLATCGAAAPGLLAGEISRGRERQEKWRQERQELRRQLQSPIEEIQRLQRRNQDVERIGRELEEERERIRLQIAEQQRQRDMRSGG